MLEINEKNIKTERWWYNPTSRLYFLSAENEPREEYRGILVAGNFNRTMSTQVRNGVPFEQGLDAGLYFSFGFSRGDWTGNETVLFDPSTETYQIDGQQWKHTEKGMRFQDLDDSVAPHILYHKERFYTAPNMEKGGFEEFALKYLFNFILHGLQLKRKERNRGIWW